MQDVSHSDIRDQIHELDRRVVRVETQVQAITESERKLSERLEEVAQTLANLIGTIDGSQRATRWLIGIGLTLVTIVLLIAQIALA
jgi:chromosome segregation ATPase